MPGNGFSQVKCEPQSEEEDSNSQFYHSYLSDQLPSRDIVKLEPECQSEDNGSMHLLQHLHVSSGNLEELSPLAPAGPAATPVCVKQEPADTAPLLTLETLESATHTGVSTFIERHMTMLSSNEMPDSTDFSPLMAVKDEPLSEGEQQHLSGDDTSDSCGTQSELATRSSPKSWSPQDMDNALEALRKHNMSLTKASATYGIPSTTLWQRAHRLGIDTPKKEGAAKSWSDADLRAALLALRAGALSANKASKAYGIPSSTLYKIARREGIRLAAPFNAAPVAWRRADLPRALAAIRAGASSVQRAAARYGIPTGTLYGRCKREGIELSRSNPTPWSEDAMGEALEAVRVGQMSINQAAIHYNLPYSSLYGRFKRCKYQNQTLQRIPDVQKPQEHDLQSQEVAYYQHVPPHLPHPPLPHGQHGHDNPNTHTYPPQYAYEVDVQEYGQAMYYNQNYILTS